MSSSEFSEKNKYQVGWERITFKSSNKEVWPNFSTDSNISCTKVDTPQRSYADLCVNPESLYKNAILCGYKPINNVKFAFPSLLYPFNFFKGYTGFIEVTTNPTDLYMTHITPTETGTIGWKGLGQVGETVCVDPILSYTDQNETYFLMGIKKWPQKTLRFICGGGMMEPNLDIYENMYKEIKEEGLGGKDVPWLLNEIKRGQFVYVGYLISPRTTNDRYQTTIACHIEISMEQAKTLNLVSDPNEDCTEPHWFPYSKVDSDKFIPPSHRTFLHLSMHDKVQYCQFPNPFWSRNQLSEFRVVMNNLSIGKINPKWAFSDFDEQVYFIAGPTAYNRTKLWLTMESLVKEKTNIVLIDPINHSMHIQNRPWLEKLEHWHLDNSNITSVFILPKGLTPKITFEEMRRNIDKNKVIIFLQHGLEKKTVKQIPSKLIHKIVWYTHDKNIAEYLLKKTKYSK